MPRQNARVFSMGEIVRQFMIISGVSRRLIFFDLFFLFGDGFIQAMVPAVIGYVVDRVTKDPVTFTKHELPWLIPLVLAGGMVFYLVAFSQHYLTQKIARSAGVSFQVELYSHLQTLSADFYQRTHVGEITSRLTKDISQGVEPLWPQLTVVFWAFSVLIPSCVSMAFLSPRLLIIFLMVMVFFVVLSRCIVPMVRQLNREVQDEAGRINARITETIAANSLIRAFAQEEVFLTAVSEHTAGYLGKALKTARVTVMFGDILNTFLVVLAPLALLLGGICLGGTGVTAGTLVAAFGYWKAAAGPMNFILNNITTMFASFSSVDRILEFFRETPGVQDKPDAVTFQPGKGEVAFEDVLFRYPDEEGSIVLNHLNLVVPAQKSLALVGESGAGKSTIVQLALRFYDPLEGRVIIDGQNLRDVTQKSLRRNIGIVMQETILMSGTIRENLSFGKPEATEAEMIAALEQASAWQFVRELPRGLDTVLGERGARLSGGQKQRLAIARVFLKNPPIVIFDEATSSLDPITEKQIQEAMKTLLAGRTAIIIAHRLSTIVNCDEIVLLDQGVVAARGSHVDLLKTSARYREMCRKQEIGLSG